MSMHIREKDISLFLDNSLSPGKQKKLEKHFAECDKCRDRLIKWQDLYSSLEDLDCDFELDGLEDRIMQKIKSTQFSNRAKQENFRISVPAILSISFIALVLNLLFEPIIAFIDKFYKNTMAFMLDESIQFINTAKWKAVDIISMFKSLELTGLAACVILISGGIYFTVNRKSVRKA